MEFGDKLKAITSWPTGLPEASIGTIRVKVGFPAMLRNGVIIEVTSVEQAQIAEDSGAVGVMVLKLPYEEERWSR